MAFGADELRVLRRALAIALHPASLSDEDVQDCLRLAGSLDEAVREAERLRAFLLADLARYRDALPAAANGYLGLLQDALATGYQPVPDDLVALRGLRGTPAGAALLDRCRAIAEQSVRARLAGRSAAPLPRTRLLAIAGGRTPASGEPPRPKKPEPAREPLERPMRPTPKPSEVFPPRKRPVPPRERRAAG
ncbi:hypothetical protein AR457_15835 [Streptomyces agglomeratus]|uniref:Uncharacterized protein n=1 Tax=Streptomyces agglomeratus TaxID=285458 RepID=A0A1E5P872_9ACTN|nr:hypothetical protein [Streptomyces agglomeratus]OEJ25718.1 hypothetical protein AS594_15670 [Streptomyces agglomeratus]OEJ40240.1 hypothetical protein BGK70_20820 [Streptomyces agglomeratus]OEJ45381.1 hypothetical protein AR457_15835 [Streptomyces agglomeratus]OEJ52790.1 hypothetical protein BGK72_20450 [Streptomyces agglomeratus]